MGAPKVPISLGRNRYLFVETLTNRERLEININDTQMNYFVIVVSLLCNEMKQNIHFVYNLHISQILSPANMIMVVAWKWLSEQEWHNNKRLVFYKIITEVLTTPVTENSSGQTLI